MMIRSNTGKALLAAVLLLGSTGSALAEADYYTGAQCQQMWVTSEQVMRSDGTIYNGSGSDVWLTCPLTMDDGDARYYSLVRVDAKDTESDDELECWIASARSDGTRYRGPAESGRSHVGPVHIELGPTFKYRPNSLTCRVPGTPGPAHFIYNYRGTKY